MSFYAHQAQAWLDLELPGWTARLSGWELRLGPAGRHWYTAGLVPEACRWVLKQPGAGGARLLRPAGRAALLDVLMEIRRRRPVFQLQGRKSVPSRV